MWVGLEEGQAIGLEGERGSQDDSLLQEKHVGDLWTGIFMLSMSIQTVTVPAFKSWKSKGRDRHVNNQSLGYVMGLPWSLSW